MLCPTQASRFLACEVLPLIQNRHLGRRAPKQGKPPILPPAKKVLYHVVHTPWQDPEDVKELLWRRHAYNNAVTSLRAIFRQERQQKANAGQGIEAMKESEEDEFNQLIKMNEERNKQKAEERASLEQEEWRKTQQTILSEIEATIEKQKAQAAQATQEVREAIERSRDFVTRENLETKILAALENPVVYDFAIDVRGNKIFDPSPVKYQEGTPTRQKGRLYDRTLGGPTVSATTSAPSE